MGKVPVSVLTYLFIAVSRERDIRIYYLSEQLHLVCLRVVSYSDGLIIAPT